MKHIQDYLTHVDNPEDLPYLKSKLLDVNERLFRVNPEYRKLVLAACDYIATHCMDKKEGYKLPHGVSAANLGIPWNIIAVARLRGLPGAYAEVMINPEITAGDGGVEMLSNCGSIRLKEAIAVVRYRRITMKWMSVAGVKQEQDFTIQDDGATIQHEVDHNNGILITDRQAP